MNRGLREWTRTKRDAPLPTSNSRIRSGLRRRFAAFALFTGVFLAVCAVRVRAQYRWDNYLYAPREGRVFGFGTRMGREATTRPCVYVSYESAWHHVGLRQHLVRERHPRAGLGRHIEIGLSLARGIDHGDGRHEVEQVAPNPFEFNRLGVHYKSVRGFATISEGPDPPDNALYAPNVSFEVSDQIVRFRSLYISLQTLLVATAIPSLLSAFALWRHWHRRYRRAKLGLCLTCGYDLRESPRRCPECGAEPTGHPGPNNSGKP